jgi:hypothetical protein
VDSASRPFACPVCRVVEEHAGSVATIAFDLDLRGASRILSDHPLDADCSNCGSTHLMYAGFAFTSVEAGVLIVLGSTKPALDDDFVTVQHFTNVNEARTAVRRHLMRLANEVLVPFQIARAEDELERWAVDVAPKVPRSHVSAALLLAPLLDMDGAARSSGTGVTGSELRDHFSALTEQLVYLRSIAAVGSALEARREPAEALDR